MSRLKILVVLTMLWGGTASAGGELLVPKLVAAHVLAADTVRAHAFTLLSQGQVSEAIDYWVLATGREAPAWLLTIRTAFDASKQVAGACQGVAQTIYTAFIQLGGEPELVELRTVSATRVPFIVFRMPGGQAMRLTETGYHILVRLNGRAYDAYTGAVGMPWAEYMSRLGARSEITQTVVSAVRVSP